MILISHWGTIYTYKIHLYTYHPHPEDCIIWKKLVQWEGVLIDKKEESTSSDMLLGTTIHSIEITIKNGGQLQKTKIPLERFKIYQFFFEVEHVALKLASSPEHSWSSI